MRILIVTSSRSPSGGARQALYLAGALHEAGYDTYFIAPENSQIWDMAAHLKRAALPEGLRAADTALRALMGDGKPVIVHAFHNRAVKLVAYLGVLWRWRKLPVACVAHRGVTSRPGNPIPYLLPGIRAFLVNSKACADTLPLLWRRRRCHIVSNSVPAERLRITAGVPDMRKRLGIPDHHIVIGTVAQDKAYKGAGRLLAAFAGIRDRLPPATLVLAGATPKTWGPAARDLGVENDVRIIGHTELVADYVQMFHLFVFPSYFIESQPNVIMEAMCLGVPVIGSRIGGVPEMLPEEFMFKAGDVEEMGGKMLEIVHSPAMLERARSVALERRPLFSVERRLEEVLRHYGNVLREARVLL